MTEAKNWEDLPLVLTVEETAQVLRVTAKLITEMCRKGELPAVKVGRAWRIKRDDVLAYLQGSSEAPGE